MGTVKYRDGIAILQIIAFAPAILCAIALMRRHGITLAWWLITMFTLARLVGASAQLITIHHPGIGADITILVTLYLGISPLVFLCWSMLLRVNQQVEKPMPLVIYRLANMLNLLALGIGSYGSYKVAHDSIATGKNVPNGFADAALVIFAVVFALSVVLFAYLLGQVLTIPKVEQLTIRAVLFAIPLLAVRITYALVSDFAHKSSFNIYSGSQTLYLCMDVLEEIAVIYIFLITGFLLPVLSKSMNTSSDIEASSGSRRDGRTRTRRVHRHHRSDQSTSVPLADKGSNRTEQVDELPRTSERQQSRASKAVGPIGWIIYKIADRQRRP